MSVREMLLLYIEIAMMKGQNVDILRLCGGS